MNNPAEINIADYDYPLPDERIAKHPLRQRDLCKLLVRHGDGTLEERVFKDLPSLLPKRSVMVCNNTKVINARLRFRKGESGDGALIEVFCLEPSSPADFAQSFASMEKCVWKCFVGNSKRWKSGVLKQSIALADGTTVLLTAERVGRTDNVSEIEFSWMSEQRDMVAFSEVIEAAGEIPIPPYLDRATEATDSTDYQTVFSCIEGSVAAPTAGLHFTPGLLAEIDAAGVERRELTLHVGAGTFQPVKSDTIGEHEMHSEFIAVALDLIRELAASQRPIVAVGTTSVRTLESMYHLGCRAAQGLDILQLPQWYPYVPNHPRLSRGEALSALADAVEASGATSLIASTKLMIAPGYDYKVVDAIITNFHQPRSTLLLLVSAFTGGDWRRFYDFALARDFRFLSYGDACLLL